MLYAKTRTRRAALQIRVGTQVPFESGVCVGIIRVHGTLEARQLVRKSRKVVAALAHTIRVKVTAPRTIHIDVLACNA